MVTLIERCAIDMRPIYARRDQNLILSVAPNLSTLPGDERWLYRGLINLMSNAHWTGVPLSELAHGLGVQPEARAITFRSADNYYESFPLALVSTSGVLLAHSMNGVPLPDKHGFPLRLIPPGRYGMKQPKFLTGIELSDHDDDGYWEQRGWDQTAAVRVYSRIDLPMEGDSVPAGEVTSIAINGDR